MPVDPRIPISKAFETPSDDEATEVEGHGITKRFERVEYARGRVMDGPADADDVTASDAEQPEVEGHITRKGYLPEHQADELAPEQAAGDDAEVEGHLIRVKVVVDVLADGVTIPTDDDGDAEGHGWRFGSAEDAANTPKAEVKGHAMRGRLMDVPADDEDASSDDTEPIVRKW